MNDNTLYLHICSIAATTPYSVLDKLLKEHELNCLVKVIKCKFPNTEYSTPEIKESIKRLGRV